MPHTSKKLVVIVFLIDKKVLNCLYYCMLVRELIHIQLYALNKAIDYNYIFLNVNHKFQGI